MAGTIEYRLARAVSQLSVSMESGLDGRNNTNHATTEREPPHGVSMESGLDGRNNGTTVASSFPITEGSQWSPA